MSVSSIGELSLFLEANIGQWKARGTWFITINLKCCFADSRRGYRKNDGAMRLVGPALEHATESA